MVKQSLFPFMKRSPSVKDLNKFIEAGWANVSSSFIGQPADCNKWGIVINVGGCKLYDFLIQLYFDNSLHFAYRIAQAYNVPIVEITTDWTMVK